MNNRLALWRAYLGYYRGFYLRVGVITTISMAQAFLVLPVAWLVRYAFDQAIPDRNFTALVLCGGVILVINVADTAISLWVRYHSLKITKIVNQKLRSTLLDKLYGFSRAYYDQANLSHLHDLVVQDTERLDIMSNAIVNQLLPALTIGIALSAVLLFLNSQLFLVVISVMPVMIVLNHVLHGRVREKINQFRQAFDVFSSGILFVLQRMDMTRVQTAEDFELKRQNAAIEHLRHTSASMAWLQSAYVSVQSLTVTISSLLILVIGGQAIINGQMTLGDLLSFYVATGLLNNYVKAGLSATSAFMLGKESLASVFALLMQNHPPPYSGTKSLIVQGEIRFEDVSFGYGDTAILSHLDLKIPARSAAALTGSNGAGKTTLVNLLLGFYAPHAGRILIDNYPLAELDIAGLRQQIAVVAQNPVLFSGTILENITYGSPDADFAMVLAACELALARQFIEEQPHGFQTQVGEGGTLLSGGQRQRIALARAMLRQPKILILDEPTNHLDQVAITELIEHLGQMEQPPTMLLISHNRQITSAFSMVYQMVDGHLAKSSPMPLQQR